jgi:DNA-binding CsgD family transcriptional regulator
MALQPAMPTWQMNVDAGVGRWRDSAPTERQIACLRSYVVAGSQEGAARRLGIEPATVRNHLAGLRLRLGVHTTAQAVYILMLGGGDHQARCGEKEHSGCVPLLKPRLQGS